MRHIGISAGYLASKLVLDKSMNHHSLCVRGITIESMYTVPRLYYRTNSTSRTLAAPSRTSTHARIPRALPPNRILDLGAQIRICQVPARLEHEMLIRDADVGAWLLGAALEAGDFVRQGRAMDGFERDVGEFKLGGAAVSCRAAKGGALRDGKGFAA